MRSRGRVPSPRRKPDRLETLSRRVGRRLLAGKHQLATAESCTGGWIAKSLTDIPGSSGWFEEGYVAYSNAAKRRTLHVRARTLAKHGAVSEAVVREMARGALAASGADTAVSVSGIAGPDGGSPGKPVGTVWFCWARRTGGSVRSRVKRKVFRGNRDAVRRKSVLLALEGVLATR